MFFIENNAANIQSTDYWDSEAGAAGYFQPACHATSNPARCGRINN